MIHTAIGRKQRQVNAVEKFPSSRLNISVLLEGTLERTFNGKQIQSY